MKIHKNILGVGLIIGFLGSFVASIPTFAATLDITLNQIETGSPDFDGDDLPGNDSSISNNIVRTNDTILYEWDFNVNGGSDDNVTITQTLPNTAKWIFIPPQCGLGSFISSDEQTITCVYDLDGDDTNGNTIPSGTAVQLYPQAKARGTAANGDLITTSASIVGDNSAQADSGSVNAIVSATPRFDIKKSVSFGNTFVPADTNHPDGFYGGITAIIVTNNDAKGNELLDPATPFVINDTLLGFLDGNTPNTQLELATWEANYCRTNQSLTPGLSTPGTLTCSQSGGAGTGITFSLLGADLSGEEMQVSNSYNSILEPGESLLGAVSATVFEPLASIPEGQTRYLENELSSTLPNSISNQIATEYNLDNNDNTIRFRNVNGTDSAKSSAVTPYPWSRTTRDLYATETYSSNINTTNSWVQDHTGVIICDKFDHTTQEYLNYTLNPTSLAHTVEYGHKDFADYNDMENTTCGDTEPGVVWSSTPQPDTNIVRAVLSDPQSPGVNIRFSTGYSIRSTFYDDALTGGHVAGDLIPNGYELWDFAAIFKDNANNAEWLVARDNLRVAHRYNVNIPEIDKSLSPDIGNNQFLSGDTVKYSLIPYIRGDSAQGITTDATIVDTLASYLSYQPGTATMGGVAREPDMVIVNGDGTTTLTWLLPDVLVGTSLDEILFDVTVSQSTPNFEIIRNDVIISTPETLAPEEERSDYQDIQVIKDAVFGVSKLVNTPQIYTDQQVEYTLEYTNSRNQPINSATLIDVFPYDQDTRATPSSFAGDINFNSITGSKGGEVFYYTSDDPAAINSDANDPSNVINTPGATTGTTIWCLPTDFTTDPDCPTANSDITAMRVELGTIPNDGAGYSLTLLFDTTGNQKGNIYTNGFEVAPEGLLNTISNDVSAFVVGSELGDYVWEDENENGVQDEPASSGINGVLATLWDAGVDMVTGGGDDTQVTQDASGNPIAPQTTANDSNGNPGFYMFRNLLPSWYYVVFDNLPNFFAVTDQNDPNSNGAGDETDDSDVVADTNSTEYLASDAVEIGINESDLNTDLGLFEEIIDLELTKEVDADGDSSFSNNEFLNLPGVGANPATTAYDYRLTISNANGDIDATGVEVTDYIPAGVTITSVTPSIGSVSTTLPITGPANLVWNTGTVTTTVDGTLDLVAQITATEDAVNGQFVNTAEVTSADQTDTDSTPDNITLPFDTNNAEDEEASVTISLRGAIGDTVFEDTNGNGIQDNSETGISQVTVNLYDATDTNTVVATTTTGSDGSYVFNNLDTSLDFIVEFDHSTAPAGVLPSPQTQGSDTATDSDGDATTGLTSIIQITSGEYMQDIDQGYIPLLEIGDFVWSDDNANGIQDGNEDGLEGVVVNLYNAADLTTVLETTTSLTDGSYSFDELNPATQYVVEFDHTTASGYSPSPSGQGTDGAVDSDGDLTTGRTSPIDLSGGESNSDIDQGYVPRASIGDLVFVDLDGNGILDGDDNGLDGVTINLYDASDLGTIISTTTSANGGTYIFDNLDAQADYVVEFEHSSLLGYLPSPQTQGSDNNQDSDGDIATGQTSTISFVGSQPIMDIDQGYTPLLSIGDTVFEDVNNNGILDGNESGIPGVTVNLYQDTDNDGIFDGGTTDTLLPFGTGSTLPGTAVTDANGNYLFDNLEAGGYFAVIPSSNLSQGGPLENFTPTTGQNGSAQGNYENAPNADTDIDSDDNGTLNANGDYVSSIITLEYNGEPQDDGDTLSSTNRTIDFSLYQMSCLGSLVWEDLNGNGIREDNEPFFEGVEVILYDSENNEVDRVLSDTNGEYEFCYLIAGDYYIEYGSLPLGYSLTQNGQDSQADPSTFQTPAFSIGYGQQGQVVIESGVVSADTLETIQLIRTGKVNLNNTRVIPYVLIVSGLLFICVAGYKRFHD